MSHACVILAAGRGQRMGERNKALLTLRGHSFLWHVVRACRAVSVSEIVAVIAAPHLEGTRAEAQILGIEVAVNPTPEEGMGSSVATGFRHAEEVFAAARCWLWPVDLPAVASETLRCVSAHRPVSAIAMPVYRERGGHPVLVARSVWPELALCGAEPEGARTIMRRDPKRVARIPVDDPAVCLDVDHPEDAAALQ